MKRKISTLLLLSILLPMTAQNVTFEGHVTDNEKNDLIASTVRYFVDDSLFVKGVTTNTNGEFKLEVPQNDKASKLVFSYIGYKNLTINIQPTKEKNIRLGDIVMKKDAVQIHEVMVLGENQVSTEEKLMVYPTKDELRHAYDGYSVLAGLMIPGLEVNSFENTLSYYENEVLLCIDGRQVAKEEILGLNAKYIKRVDIYTMGKPEFPESSCVIDYIMKELDYAGTVSANAEHQLTRLNGNGRVTAQYYHKKSEFAVSISGNYNDFKEKAEDIEMTTYHFPEKDIIRTNKSLPSLKQSDNQNAYANYIYRDNIQDFYASFRFNRKVSENDIWDSRSYNNVPAIYIRQENTQSQNINPALQFRYNRTLPNSQRLRTELYCSFGNNDYVRWYEQRENDQTANAYRNETDEKSNYLKGTVNYTKTFKNKSSLSIELSQDFTNTDNINLRDEDIYDISLYKSNTRFLAAYNYRIKNKLNIMARLATHISHVSTGNNNVTNYFFTPYMRLTYKHKKHSLSLSGTINSQEVDNTNRTGDEYRKNEYEIYKGNPELKDYMTYDVRLTHSWNISSRLKWSQGGSGYFYSDCIYYNRYFDENKNAIVREAVNKGNSFVLNYFTTMQYDIVPKMLIFQGSLMYFFYKAKAVNTIYLHDPYFISKILFRKNAWLIDVGLQSKRKGITTGEVMKFDMAPLLRVKIGYNIKQWNFEAAYYNPFKATTRMWLQSDVLTKESSNRSRYISDKYGYVKVSYRFNYGKKKHKFDNTEVIDVNQTTISK